MGLVRFHVYDYLRAMIENELYDTDNHSHSLSRFVIEGFQCNTIESEYKNKVRPK